MNEETTLKVISIFEIALASLAGACFPFLYLLFCQSEGQTISRGSLDSEPIFFLLKALSCGIILGVALCHLLPDADELLGDRWEYPVCFASCGLGIMLCLICEQFAMWIVSTTRNSEVVDGKSIEPLLEGDKAGNAMSEHRSHSQSLQRRISGQRTVSISGRPVRFESNCELGMAVNMFSNISDTKTLLKAYVLEGAIAVHSVIMGVSLGALGNGDIAVIKVLMIAYGFHQLLEGISLGCAISATDLDVRKIVGLVVFFSGTLPIGIVIGLSMASATESDTGETIAGFANALAAGILLYVSLVEMLADEFSNNVVVNNYALKTKMILCITGGIGIMALLALWA